MDYTGYIYMNPGRSWLPDPVDGNCPYLDSSTLGMDDGEMVDILTEWVDGPIEYGQ